MRNGLIVAALILLLDQVSKLVLVDFMVARDGIPLNVTPFFDLVMVWNTGVSFGMFSGGPEETRLILFALNIIVAIALVFWLRKSVNWTERYGIALVIGGALGNAIDRIHYGAVADFFSLYVNTWHWPAFNVADIAISVGVGILLFDSLFLSGKSDKKAA